MPNQARKDEDYRGGWTSLSAYKLIPGKLNKVLFTGNFLPFFEAQRMETQGINFSLFAGFSHNEDFEAQISVKCVFRLESEGRGWVENYTRGGFLFQKQAFSGI